MRLVIDNRERLQRKREHENEKGYREKRREHEREDGKEKRRENERFSFSVVGEECEWECTKSAYVQET